ncbi:MAG: hypothetical protein K9I25_04920 [Crocinitomicaceae bacterium]|jgi:hypothetical protein|nr:hypothetical protein [Crocinitomicaceae bacterium]
MKLSELIPNVEGIELAVILENDTPEYAVYLHNAKEDIIEGIIITSVGYGENPTTGETIKTATLRHSLEVMLPNEVAKIELIVPEVFGLYNEYWVSFWINEELFDKRFLFLPDAIHKDKLTLLESFGKPGVLLS